LRYWNILMQANSVPGKNLWHKVQTNRAPESGALQKNRVPGYMLSSSTTMDLEGMFT
jgi:hypothetical protein